MALAILVPYCVDQNEPSKPFERLVTLPDDGHPLAESQRDAQLILAWRNVFATSTSDPGDFGLEDWDDLEVVDGQEYGDLKVGSEFGDTFLFVTYIELPCIIER